MASRERKLFRCTFQVEANTRLGRLLHFVLSSREDDSVRNLIRETLEIYWTPIYLVNQYKAGFLTDEEYRQQVLLAVFRLQAWSSYCQRVSAVGTVTVDAYSTAFLSSNAESKAPNCVDPDPEVSSVNPAQPIVDDEPGDSAVSTVEMPNLPFAGRRSISMKPAFGGAYLQDEDDD